MKRKVKKPVGSRVLVSNDKPSSKAMEQIKAAQKGVEEFFLQGVTTVEKEFEFLHAALVNKKKTATKEESAQSAKVAKKLGELLDEAERMKKGTDQNAMRKWLIQYNLVEKEMASQLPWLKAQSPYTEKTYEKSSKERADFVSGLHSRLDDAEKLAETLSDTTKNSAHNSEEIKQLLKYFIKDKADNTIVTSVRLGLASLLGPAAPIAHLAEKMLVLDKSIPWLTEKFSTKMGGWFKKLGKNTEDVKAAVERSGDQSHKDLSNLTEEEKAQAEQQSVDKEEAERQKDLNESSKVESKHKGAESSTGFGIGSLLGLIKKGKSALFGMLGFGKDGIFRKLGSTLLGVGTALGLKSVSLIKGLGKLIFKDGFGVIKDLGKKLLIGSWSLIKNVGSKLVGILSDGLMSLGESIAAGVGELLAAPELLVGAAIVAAVAAIGYFAWKYRKQIMEFASDVWGKIKNVASEAWGKVKDISADAWGFMQKHFPKASAEIATLASSTWDTLKTGATDAASKVEEYAKDGWNAVKKSPVGELADYYSKIYTWMWDKVKGLASGLWDKVKDLWGGAKKVIAPVAQKAEHIAVDASRLVASGGKLAGSAIQNAGELATKAGAAIPSKTLSTIGNKATGFGQQVSAYSGAMGSQAAGTVASLGGKVLNVAGLQRPNVGVKNAIMGAAEKTGVDPGILFAISQAESGFKSDAQATTSSAGGLFQFTDGTWSDMVKKYGKQYGVSIKDKMNPQANALMGALFVRDNQRYLASKGIAPDAGNTYMAHFLGAGTAASYIDSMYKNPNADAAALFPKQAQANKSIFYNRDGSARTMKQVYDLMTGNPTKVTVAKAAGYDKMFGVSTPGQTPVEMASNKGSVVSQPSMSQKPPTPIRTAAASAPAPATDYKVASSNSGPQINVHSVPSYLSDEGLLILNAQGVA